MEIEGWLVEKVHGNIYQAGWPDLYCFHRTFGQRWIETKVHNGYLRQTQIDKFTKWQQYGIGIWVLRDERDYEWLFKDPNWHKFISAQSRPGLRICQYLQCGDPAYRERNGLWFCLGHF